MIRKTSYEESPEKEIIFSPFKFYKNNDNSNKLPELHIK